MPPPLPMPLFEFHISRAARERYGVDDTLFSLSGNVVLANLPAVRRLARQVSERRVGLSPPLPELSPGDLNAMGLIDEALHLVAAMYQRERDPRSMSMALESIERELGRDRLDAALRAFVGAFPNSAVHRGQVTASGWLAGETAGTSHRAIALEEMLLLWLGNANPAFHPFRELFDDRELPDREAYAAVIGSLRRWFAERPRYGPFEQPLVDMLRSPALEHPDSLSGQLDYIRRHWGYLLGDFLLRLLTGLDVLGEEARARWMRTHPADWERLKDSGPGAILRFDHADHEPERFSPDRDWMPCVVLIAKSVYVWLDQLSRRHARDIRRLDQIPDEELDRFARWGINGLWLIGVWERSRASQTIKQRCGNPEAAASAYSLLDYVIAHDLGGELALDDLKRRAWARGIRLASDMVPNHMGVDSRWVIEHPDWFLSLSESPFPAYTFHGPDLSNDDRVTIQIDDHYYDRTDAAVVFKRTDRWTGDARFIYHGNDGTSYPWNDTAQLDYLNPRTREAVIQTILHVARQFPIIRFDAAMTLAKRHYQRLWYPEPGTGGAIPSRAEHGLTKAQFDAAMPQEFWREVVDRAAVEAPETLLLAEAFWLMEGYFVRTLGMHRVYNSAFMNMLRDERNANYRSVIKNTLEFDPEILKRYVNFMSNPDERTAVDQFGREDKYFGACTLMVTLPGLPMFGHGQVEGFEERYGMEYRRAYRDEQPDPTLVARHEREIFPLLHRRALFAEVREFRLYDFFTAEGHVNEDVFAYSNRRGDERALVVYHNRWAEAAGWIRTSAGFAVIDAGTRTLHQRSLGDGLGLTPRDGVYCRLRDVAHGLEYLRASRELCERGFYVELGAYQRHVFLDPREVRDSARDPWAGLARELNGRGVPSLDDALDELRRRPLTVPFRELLDAGLLGELAARVPAAQGAPAGAGDAVLVDRLVARVREVLEAARAAGMSRADAASLAARVRERIAALRAPEGTGSGAKGGAAAKAGTAAKAGAVAKAAAPARVAATPGFQPAWGTQRTWAIVVAVETIRALGELAGYRDARAARVGDLAREWRLDRVLREALAAAGLEASAAQQATDIVFALLAHVPAFEDAARRRLSPDRVFAAWLGDEPLRHILGVHTHADIEWFRKESFDDWFGLIAAVADLRPAADAGRLTRGRGRATPSPGRPAKEPAGTTGVWIARLEERARLSGWRTDGLLAASPAVEPPERAPRRSQTAKT